jgi:hypothetical protein
MLKKQQYVQSRMGRADQDSYYDPAEDGGIQGGDDDYQNDHDDMHQEHGQRLTKDNILMRDMMGL